MLVSEIVGLDSFVFVFGFTNAGVSTLTGRKAAFQRRRPKSSTEAPSEIICSAPWVVDPTLDLKSDGKSPQSTHFDALMVKMCIKKCQKNHIHLSIKDSGHLLERSRQAQGIIHMADTCIHSKFWRGCMGCGFHIRLC